MESFQEIVQRLYNFVSLREQSLFNVQTVDQLINSQNETTQPEKKLFVKWLQSKFYQYFQEQFQCCAFNKKNKSSFKRQEKANELIKSGQEHKFTSYSLHLWQLFDKQCEENNSGASQTLNQTELSQNKQIKVQKIRQNFYNLFSKICTKQKEKDKEKVDAKIQGQEYPQNDKNKPNQYIFRFQDQEKNYARIHQPMFWLVRQNSLKSSKLDLMYDQFQDKSLTLINPSVSAMNKLIQQLSQNKHQQDRSNKNSRLIDQFILLKPQTIILATSNFKTLLSTIITTHLLYYCDFTPFFQQQFLKSQYNFDNSPVGVQKQAINIDRKLPMLGNKKNFIKIITTKEVYSKYLSLFAFIKIINEFWSQFWSSPQYNQTKYTQFVTNQDIQAAYKSFTEQNTTKIQNKTNFILSSFHFHIINPGENVFHQKIHFSFTNFNLFPFQSYDIQINQSQSSQVRVLIEGNHLKNVKKIYYAHKKGLITEQFYLNIVKRLEYKQTLLKNNKKVIFFSSYNSTITEKQNVQIYSLQNFIYVTFFHQENQNSSKIYPNIKKSSLIENDWLKIDPKGLLDSKQSQNKNMTFHNPHSISVGVKNQLFYQVRQIQQFSTLSDVEIIQILNEGTLIQYKATQTIHNSSLNLEHVFIILKGVCLEKSQNHLQQVAYLSKNDMFGWSDFLFSIKTQGIQQNHQTLNFSNEKDKSVQAFSHQLVVLRVSMDFMAYLLYDKLDFLRVIYHKDGPQQKEFQLFLKQALFPKFTNEILRKKINFFNNVIFLYRLLSERQKININLLKKCQSFDSNCSEVFSFEESKSLQLLLGNYPNLILWF